jgi:hypothetical protein
MDNNEKLMVSELVESHTAVFRLRILQQDLTKFGLAASHDFENIQISIERINKQISFLQK